MPRMPDLARGYRGNRNTLARAVAILDTERLVSGGTRAGTIVRAWHVPARAAARQHGHARPFDRRPRLQLPGRVRPGVVEAPITPAVRYKKLTDPG